MALLPMTLSELEGQFASSVYSVMVDWCEAASALANILRIFSTLSVC